MSSILTRKETIARLRLKPAHFSKIVNGKVKGLPPLACLRIGRHQLFRDETIEQWLREVEQKSCSTAR
jgi:hypothetical protein